MRVSRAATRSGAIFWLVAALISSAVGYGVTLADSRAGPQTTVEEEPAVTQVYAVGGYSVARESLPRVEMLPCCLTIAGSYPGIRYDDRPIEAVNVALSNVVVSNERAWASAYDQGEVQAMKGAPAGAEVNPGLYGVRADFVAVSSRIASVLISVSAAPGGTAGSLWISANVLVPSGRPVNLLNTLFTRPATVESLLGRESNQAFRTYSSSFQVSPPLQVSPPFESLALARDGLLVGFTGVDFGGTPGTRLEVTVPYGLLTPYLSNLGRVIVDSM